MCTTAEARGQIEKIIAAIDALLPLTSSMAGLSTLCTAQREANLAKVMHKVPGASVKNPRGRTLVGTPAHTGEAHTGADERPFVNSEAQLTTTLKALDEVGFPQLSECTSHLPNPLLAAPATLGSVDSSKATQPTTTGMLLTPNSGQDGQVLDFGIAMDISALDTILGVGARADEQLLLTEPNKEATCDSMMVTNNDAEYYDIEVVESWKKYAQKRVACGGVKDAILKQFYNCIRPGCIARKVTCRDTVHDGRHGPMRLEFYGLHNHRISDNLKLDMQSPLATFDPTYTTGGRLKRTRHE